MGRRDRPSLKLIALRQLEENLKAGRVADRITFCCSKGAFGVGWSLHKEIASIQVLLERYGYVTTTKLSGRKRVLAKRGALRRNDALDAGQWSRCAILTMQRDLSSRAAID